VKLFGIQIIVRDAIRVDDDDIIVLQNVGQGSFDGHVFDDTPVLATQLGEPTVIRSLTIQLGFLVMQYLVVYNTLYYWIWMLLGSFRKELKAEAHRIIPTNFHILNP
jgi:hypothetical protein